MEWLHISYFMPLRILRQNPPRLLTSIIYITDILQFHLRNARASLIFSRDARAFRIIHFLPNTDRKSAFLKMGLNSPPSFRALYPTLFIGIVISLKENFSDIPVRAIAMYGSWWYPAGSPGDVTLLWGVLPRKYSVREDARAKHKREAMKKFPLI